MGLKIRQSWKETGRKDTFLIALWRDSFLRKRSGMRKARVRGWGRGRGRQEHIKFVKTIRK